ncbi:PREDICTED: uncharacterized protein LOC109155280 [Ipomoea nil]|uniref:uncharacterized protein LOC109155280 n=1 Tax=Ipomoea nil TaxID=35883 RepID=UPI0009009DCC|nr:PREDICTED: uncharacterized protein LOC109155280 [Ipomoea nil]
MATRKKEISPCIVARGAPGVSHLFFANDSLLFFKASISEAEAVKGCLMTYERMSGQSVNYNKSCIVFSGNTAEDRRNAVATVFNVTQSGSIGKYLGLPMGIGRNKKEVFSYIETKLIHRLSGWNKKLLSKAGKEILLKSVAQVLPTYTMSLYLLPVTFSKQGWRLLTQPNSIVAQLYKARYYPNVDFLEANIGANPSFCWRSILAGQHLLQQGCFRRIGNGGSTTVWNQPWLPNDDDPYVRTPLPQGGNMKVSDLIDPILKDWNTALLNNIFQQRDVDLILQIPVSIEYDDVWCWKGDVRGIYYVKQGYRNLLEHHDNTVAIATNIWNIIWKLKIPPHVHNFLWRCFHGILPTLTVLAARRVEVDIMCPI